MIVISADRPQSKIDIGDDKPSVRKMYLKIIACTMRICMRMFQPSDLKSTRRLIRLLLKRSVHINAPFEEPLYETVSTFGQSKYCCFRKCTQTISIEDVSEYTIWNNSTKKMILVGVNVRMPSMKNN
jgi:2-succinyl-5-enolpyruvyl-6-hydroxy-3-cyclohexene-1-carboxylate synthase